MADINPTESMSGDGAQEGRVRGARRQRVYGYLKAANEIRHSYQQQWQQSGQGDDEKGVPGSFPDVEIIRSGDEEMVLFPSYSRKHIKKNPGNLPSGSREVPGAHDDIENPESGDADYWRREWERYEDDNAVVDVDVRGWIYTPHRMPMNRRNRLLVAVARRLSGLPAPVTTPPGGHAASEHLSRAERIDERTKRSEEEAAAREVQSIVRKGELESKIAWAGGYSEDPEGGYEGDNMQHISPFRSHGSGGHLRNPLTDSEVNSEDEDPMLTSLSKRHSWNQPASMSKEELATANHHLMSRLKPFMTAPLANTAITVFFFNDQKSRSRSVHTNDAGHFNVRASLDFVPTSIRVLASESLSAVEKVKVVEDKGISLVSDIDDTIKHSAIASGAREIFKNTFIRDLGDLTIQGVKEWYNKMADLGVQLHYVSNSPWQLYPVLRTYFSLAGLPHGSFHLKAYTGMLQGIFEPAAERKRGSLERIMHDFPERKFILVGDSGEADLEVYSDVVNANPGRVLAVYIRDVTTPEKKKFFDQALTNVKPDSRVQSSNGYTRTPPSETSDVPENRPSLPLRRKAVVTIDDKSQDVEGDLIDFDDDPAPEKSSEPKSYSSDLLELQDTHPELTKSHPPARPVKPSGLRGTSIEPHQVTNHDRISNPDSKSPVDGESKPLPPGRPRRSSLLVDLPSTAAHTHPHPTRPEGPSHTASSSAIRSIRPNFRSRHTTTNPPTSQPQPEPQSHGSRPSDASVTDSEEVDPNSEGYVASARRQLGNAYNALPTLRSTSPAPGASNPVPGTDSKPPAPRRGLTAYPAAAARWATGATGGDPAAGGDGGAHPGASYNKKEEVWKRRWARAEELMKSKGVVLRTWRVGSDVMDECVQLVERGKQELERESGRRGGVSMTSQHGGGSGSVDEGRAGKE